jgi:hypothetical protein
MRSFVVHVIVLDPITWLDTVIPVLAIIGVAYAVVSFAFWKDRRD